jgi:hypothetical protein
MVPREDPWKVVLDVLKLVVVRSSGDYAAFVSAIVWGGQGSVKSVVFRTLTFLCEKRIMVYYSYLQRKCVEQFSVVVGCSAGVACDRGEYSVGEWSA